jgi:hypothetical protein
MTRTQARRLAWQHALWLMQQASSEGFNIAWEEGVDEDSRQGRQLQDAFVYVMGIAGNRANGNRPARRRKAGAA